jgi:nucleoside-diphosphate-sugar epimerase
MRYLVIGGTGFIGAYVVRDLLAAGHEVTVLDLAPDNQLLANVLGGTVPDGVDVRSGDVSDRPALLRTMGAAKVDRIIHLAGMLGLSSEVNPARTLKVNCEGTINVFEAALALGVDNVVWASTIAVFGGHDSPDRIANDAPHAPRNLYGATKSLNERLGAHYQHSRGLDNVGLRYTAVYGYGKEATLARGTSAVTYVELLENPARGQPGVIAGGNDMVDWLYVEDAARATCLAAEAPPSPSPGLTICGDARPMQEAVAYVRQLLPDADLRVETDRPDIVHDFDSSVTEAAIGYRRQFGMEEGFRQTINVVRAQQGLAPV